MNNLPPMTLFDYMVSSRENNMLKAFLPYVDRDFQPMLATYIKYTELLATIDLFSNGRNVFAAQKGVAGFTDIISSMLPYVSEKEREAFETVNNIKNTMDMFETYKDMMSPDMMDAFNNFGDFNSFSDSDSSDVTSNDCDTSESADTDHSGDDNAHNSDNEGFNSSGSNMSDMLTSMLSPEQLLMFQQFSGMMNDSQ